MPVVTNFKILINQIAQFIFEVHHQVVDYSMFDFPWQLDGDII